MTMKPLQIGIIGLAHLHPRSYMAHFNTLEQVRVVAVAEENPSLLEPFQREFSLAGYEDWRQMIGAQQLDLAVIFLPHAQCPEAATACALRGIHQLVEKPAASSSAGILQMVEASDRQGTLISTPYVWRYHPVARKMKTLIQAGVLGEVAACTGRCAAGRLHRYIEGHASWMLNRSLSGGGPMLNLGVHWIDLFRWLLEDEAVDVMGRTLQINHQYDIEDHCLAMVQMSHGALLDLDISYTVPESFPHGRDLYLSLRGTRGVITWAPSFEGLQETLFVCSDEGEYRQPQNQQIPFTLPAHPGYAGIAGLEFLKELAASIQGHTPPAVQGNDALRALEIVEAIYRSADSGHRELVVMHNRR